MPRSARRKHCRGTSVFARRFRFALPIRGPSDRCRRAPTCQAQRQARIMSATQLDWLTEPSRKGAGWAIAVTPGPFLLWPLVTVAGAAFRLGRGNESASPLARVLGFGAAAVSTDISDRQAARTAASRHARSRILGGLLRLLLADRQTGAAAARCGPDAAAHHRRLTRRVHDLRHAERRVPGGPGCAAADTPPTRRLLDAESPRPARNGQRSPMRGMPPGVLPSADWTSSTCPSRPRISSSTTTLRSSIS